MAGLKEKVAKGAIWVTLERFATQIVGFVVGMVLARLLTPQDYGTVALLSIFFAIAGALASCGFGNALVQNKNAGDLEFNSVFYMSIAVSGVIYVVFFFAAPWIADFYKVPVLCPVTRVSALQFIFGAINGVQGAELSRKMLFYKRFRISIITCLVSAVCGITFAYLGWGVWALVLSSLITSIASIIAWWTIIAWRPKLMFSFKVLKGLFDYGWKLSLSGLLHTIYSNLYGFLVGKIYTPADLAYVNKGNAIPNLLYSSIDGTINSVSFPALAKLQDDKTKVVDGMRRMIQCSTFLVYPVLALLAICAGPMTLLLYGEQWEPAVKFVSITCFSFVLAPFCSINCNAISALGRSDAFLIMEIIKKTSGILLMLVSIRHGVMAFVMTISFVQVPLSVIVNTVASGKLLGYTMKMQFKDVLPSAFLCLGMFCVVYGSRLLLTPVYEAISIRNVAYFMQLVVEGMIGVTVYFGLAIAFKLKPCMEYLNIASVALSGPMPNVARFLDKLRNTKNGGSVN